MWIYNMDGAFFNRHTWLVCLYESYPYNGMTIQGSYSAHVSACNSVDAANVVKLYRKSFYEGLHRIHEIIDLEIVDVTLQPDLDPCNVPLRDWDWL